VPDDDSAAIATPAVLVTTAIILAGVLGGAYQLFAFVWQRSPLEDVTRQPGGWVGAIVMFVAGAAIHELLHAAAWTTVAHVPWTMVSFRRSRRKLGIIAQLDVPVPAGRYRIGAAVPALMLGIVPILVGILTGSGLVALWGDVFLFESFSDVAILAAIRRLPPYALVIE